MAQPWLTIAMQLREQIDQQKIYRRQPIETGRFDMNQMEFTRRLFMRSAAISISFRASVARA